MRNVPYKNKVKYNGWVYVLKIYIGPEVVYKIGTTNRNRVLVRALEIAGELYDILGYIPKISVLRQERLKDNYKVETEVLNSTCGSRCTVEALMDLTGYSELRQMCEIELLEHYDRCKSMNHIAIKQVEIGL